MRTPLKSRPKRGSKKERVAESRGWPGESRTSWTMAGASPVEGAAGLTDLVLSFFSASSQWEHLRARAGGAECVEGWLAGECRTWSAGRSGSVSSGAWAEPIADLARVR